MRKIKLEILSRVAMFCVIFAFIIIFFALCHFSYRLRFGFFKHLHFIRISHFIFGQLENLIVTAITTLKMLNIASTELLIFDYFFSVWLYTTEWFVCACVWFFCAVVAVASVSPMHRCWGKSFNFIIWVGWHARSLFHPLDTGCHKSTQTSHLPCDWDCDSYLVFAEFQTMRVARATEPNQKKIDARSKEAATKKNGDRTVKENKNNHEIVVNLVVSHWCSSVFIQEISFFLRQSWRCEANANTIQNIQKIIHRRKKKEISDEHKQEETHTQREKCVRKQERKREKKTRSRLTIHGMLNPNVFVSLFILRFYVGNIYLLHAHMHTHQHTNTPATASN